MRDSSYWCFSQLCLVFILSGWAVSANAGISHDSARQWQTLHSQNFRIHYHDGLQAHAKNVAGIAEDIHTRLSAFFLWQPKKATDIVLMDEIDFANGYATPLPYNRIVLWLNPPEDGLMDFGPWLESLITHEYVHTLHLDKSEGIPAFLQHFFGRHPLLFPNLFQPTWLIEGLATHLETDEQRGIGRGQSSYFDMLMRVEVLNGIKPLSQINQPIASWPAGAVHYAYGVEFYKFLMSRYGEKGIRRLVEKYSDNIIPAVVNGSFNKAFLKNLKTLWPEFETMLNTRYLAQQQAIHESGSVEGERLSLHGYMTGKAKLTPQGDLIYVRQDGRSQAGLFLKSKGELHQAERILDLTSAASIDVSSTGQIVIAQPERRNNASIFYDLYSYNLSEKSLQRLTHGKRYRYAAWSPDGDRLAAVRFSRGQYFVDLLDSNGVLIRSVWQGRAGEIVSHIDWSPVEDAIVATVWRQEGGWNIELLSISEGQWRYLTQDGSIQLHPTFSQDGKSIFFSADYDGIYNLYRLDLKAKRTIKLTNVVSGIFYPIQAANGDVFYTGYNADGYDLYRLRSSDLMALSVEAKQGSSHILRDTPMLDAGQWSISAYQPLQRLLPTWWSPILGIDENTVIAGASTSGADPLMRHNYGLALVLDSESRSLYGGIGYAYDRWLPLLSFTYGRNISRKTDGGGALLKVRERDFFQAGVDVPFMYMRRQWALHSAIVTDEEQDGYVERGVTREPSERDALLGLGASYNSTRYYPLSVSVSNGRMVSLRHENSDAFNSDYQGEVVTLDWREFFALGGEHVLALRGVIGEGDAGSRAFELGGSDSGGEGYFVTPSSVGMLFNQRDYPLRGYPDGLPSLQGRKARLYSAEWRFPIKRIERGIMAPPLALDQLSAAIFHDVGSAWNSRASKEEYKRGTGIELYADSYILYRFPVRFRLGYAHGHDRGGGNEFYLRLGSAF